MASLTRSPAMASTMRHQLSAMGSVRQFSLFQNQKQRSLLWHGIGSQLSHNTSSPKPSLPTQQYRTFLAKLTRRFPASAPSAQSPITHAEAETHSSSSSSPPSSSTPSSQPQEKNTPLQLTNLPYFVRRTPSNQLPVYLETKAGGTKRLTKIQKTEGDLEVLRSDLAKALNLESDESQPKKKSEVTINQLNGHIIVKGWRKDEIQKFLLDRNF